MARNVRVGLIQTGIPRDVDLSNPDKATIERVREAMFAKHLPLIEEAARNKVNILGMQELFNGPYFCPAQDPGWYDFAEPCPGPTVERMQPIARQHGMVLV